MENEVLIERAKAFVQAVAAQAPWAEIEPYYAPDVSQESFPTGFCPRAPFAIWRPCARRAQGPEGDQSADHRDRERRLVRPMRGARGDLDRHARGRLRHAETRRPIARPFRPNLRVQRRAHLAPAQLRLLRGLVIRPSRPRRAPAPRRDRAASGRGTAPQDRRRARGRAAQRRPRRPSRHCRCTARPAAGSGEAVLGGRLRERGAQALIGGDAAGDDQRLLRISPERIDIKLHGARAVRSLTMSATASWKLAQRSATSCSPSGARSIASCRSAVLRPASEKCGSARPSIGRGSAMVALPALGACLDRGPAGIAEARAAWPPCRRPRPAHRRWWCRAAYSGRRP